MNKLLTLVVFLTTTIVALAANNWRQNIIKVLVNNECYITNIKHESRCDEIIFTFNNHKQFIDICDDYNSFSDTLGNIINDSNSFTLKGAAELPNGYLIYDLDGVTPSIGEWYCVASTSQDGIKDNLLIMASSNNDMEALDNALFFFNKIMQEKEGSAFKPVNIKDLSWEWLE